MVCDDANTACPIMPGAAARFTIPYDDPKRADGTPHEAMVYNDCLAQMGRELLWAMHQVRMRVSR